MSTKAEELLIPAKTGIFRIVPLYVGQGDATLLIIPDNDAWKFVLIDTNEHESAEGIDVPWLLEDLLENYGHSLDVFINTHPHTDHIKGLKKIHEKTPIKEVWHSGHESAGKHRDDAQELYDVIDDIGEENEYILNGTNSINQVRNHDKATDEDKPLGDIDYQVLSPAEYVTGEVNGEEDAEKRYNRIHEMCGVIKFSYGSPDKTAVMIAGDSDKAAWQDHITDYHKEHLDCYVLRASHHGSRTFFKTGEDDEDVFEGHMEAMKPTFVLLSAPPKDDNSQFDHPHDDAMELYRKHVEEDDLIHLGEEKVCVIIDIHNDGECSVEIDKELVAEYGLGETAKSDKGGFNNGKPTSPKVVFPAKPHIDRKESGQW